MSKFFASPCRSVRARVYDAQGDLVATVAYRRDEAEEARAVALIVAAPELLAACQAIVAAFDALPPGDPARCSRLHINAARIALAKAASVQSPA